MTINSNVHKTAIVEAELDPSVSVGAFSIIGRNANIGPRTVIGSHCVVGENSVPVTIGADSILRSHTVIYGGSTYGDGLETGHHATLREGVTAGINLRVGTLSDLQGDVQLGDYVRLHSNVHVGKFSSIGDFVWIFPYTVLTNDPHPPSEVGLSGPTIGSYSIIGAQCCVLPSVEVGRGAMIGAGSVVVKNVRGGFLAIGSPAKEIKPLTDVLSPSGEKLYPWTMRYTKGFPSEVVERWRVEE